MTETPAPAGSSPKVVITGTGRAGTTFLVQVLTDLGLDTGYTANAEGDSRVHGGLERDILAPDAPRIIKAPTLSTRLAGLLERGEVVVEHVIVPMRELDIAAASRVRSTKYGTNLRTPGGLFGTANATKQRTALAMMQYELFYTVARFELPLTLLVFPRFAEDWEYTYRQLRFLAPDLPAEAWRDSIAGRYRPGWVHQEPLSGNERLMTLAGTAYQRGIGAPLRAAKRMVRGQPARVAPEAEPTTGDGTRS